MPRKKVLAKKPNININIKIGDSKKKIPKRRATKKPATKKINYGPTSYMPYLPSAVTYYDNSANLQKKLDEATRNQQEENIKLSKQLAETQRQQETALSKFQDSTTKSLGDMITEYKKENDQLQLQLLSNISSDERISDLNNKFENLHNSGVNALSNIFSRLKNLEPEESKEQYVEVFGNEPEKSEEPLPELNYKDDQDVIIEDVEKSEEDYLIEIRKNRFLKKLSRDTYPIGYDDVFNQFVYGSLNTIPQAENLLKEKNNIPKIKPKIKKIKIKK